MTLFGRHPGLRRLSRFVDREAGEPDEAGIQEHLAECGRCRSQLAFLLELRETAREIAPPSPPKGTFDEILRRRAAGERVILPMSTPPARTSAAGLAVLLALLAGLAGGISLLFLGVGEATAGASSLEIGPERPRLGQPLEIGFRTASPLASEEGVILRGRYRTADAGAVAPEAPLGAPFRQELEGTRGGRFAGTAWLPPNAVYAAFVVERADGARIETDAGRPWEVLVHDDDGRPAFAALEQRFRALDALNLADGKGETALRMTALYPEEPEGWLFRLMVERSASPDEAERIEREHRGRLPQLEQAVSRLDDPGGDRLAALANYARMLGEEDARELWERRLLEQYPRHRYAQQLRTLSIVAGSGSPSGDPGEQMRAFELEWARAGAMDRFFLEMAFDAALATDDTDLVRTWADRYARFQPEDVAGIVDDLMSRPPHRALGIEWARRELRRLEAPTARFRGLLQTSRRHRLEVESDRRSLLVKLGRALLAEGRREAALDTLKLAAGGPWLPGLVRELAPLRVAAGDTSGGLALFGLAAADPLSPEDAVRVEAEAALGRELADPAWSELVERGRRDVRRRVGAAPTRWPATAGPVRLRDAQGQEVRLASLLEERVGLLAFWSPRIREEAELDELAPRLERAGARVVPVWAEPPPDGVAIDPAAAFHDARREASAAYGAWARPWYVVVDEAGRIRYEGESLDDAFRHAFLLAELARDG